MAVQLKKRRFTVEEYHQMVQAGILREDDRVELIDGEVIEMSPIGPRHASRVSWLTQLLFETLGRSAVVWSQNPVHLSQHSEPQPDIVLLRPRKDFYAGGEPEPADVLLLVEIADTTLELDRRVKLPLYARGGIPEVWLIDLQQDVVTIYADPTPNGYGTARLARRGEQLAPAALPHCTLAVTDLLQE